MPLASFPFRSIPYFVLAGIVRALKISAVRYGLQLRSPAEIPQGN